LSEEAAAHAAELSRNEATAAQLRSELGLTNAALAEAEAAQRAGNSAVYAELEAAKAALAAAEDAHAQTQSERDALRAAADEQRQLNAALAADKARLEAAAATSGADHAAEMERARTAWDDERRKYAEAAARRAEEEAARAKDRVRRLPTSLAAPACAIHHAPCGMRRTRCSA
jgi:hypothetical protein